MGAEGVEVIKLPEPRIDCIIFPGNWQAKRKKRAVRMKPVKGRSILNDISSPTIPKSS